MQAIDLEAGMAQDYLEIFEGPDCEEGKFYVAQINLQDDDEIHISWGKGDKEIFITLPADRIRRLLVGDDK